MKSYAGIKPISEPIPAVRQGSRRHYGVHPYFTRRPFNVVRDYIHHYSRAGDRVLDPFGGSGVTAIEAFLENRVGIHNDINPLANFIAGGIADLSKGEIGNYRRALDELRGECRTRLMDIQMMDEKGLIALQLRLSLPKNVRLPSNADVKWYHDLFSARQLVSLAVLKNAIDSLKDAYARKAMLLAWSASLTKLNKTFLSAAGRAESRGGSSIFSIYRYKVAKNPVELSPWDTFKERARNVLAAKAEIDQLIELKSRLGGWHGRFEAHAKDIEELENGWRDEIDYIFTDPPYGGHISYLDLSTLWNVWLDQMPSMDMQECELIVGGELKHAEETYIQGLSKSIRSCINMLKQGRWLSVVFQHWNVAYFEAILTSAAEAGAELKAAVSQVGDPIWSMHKKKRNASVLAGELILTFHKTGANQHILKSSNNFDVSRTVGEILVSSPPKIYGEALFNRIVLDAWRNSAIRSLDVSKTGFIQIMKQHGWHYDEKHHYWVKENTPQSTLFSL